MIRPEELFQSLSLCETLQHVVSIYVSEIGLLTKIAVAFFSAIVITWSLVLLPILLAVMGVKSEDFLDPDFLQNHLAYVMVLNQVYQIVAIMIGAIAGGAFCLALAELYAGHRPDWIACLKGSLKNAPALWLAAFLALLATFIGFLLLFFPGIYVSVLVSLFVLPIVIEKVGSYRSIERSVELVKGSWCYVFSTTITITVVVIAVQALWSAITLGGSDGGRTLYSIKGSIVALVPVLLSGPIYACTQFAIYISLRVQKEGMTFESFSNEFLGEPNGDEGSYGQVAVKDDEFAGKAPLDSVV